MSLEQENLYADITPLGYNSVNRTVRWIDTNLATGEQINARRTNLKRESEDIYDFLIGMAQIRNVFTDRSISGLMAYEKGFIFMLRAFQQQAFDKGVPIELPDRARIQAYLDDLLDLEYNYPQIDEVKSALFREDKATFTEFSSALVDMQGTPAVEVLEQSLQGVTLLKKEAMIAKETALDEVIREAEFQSHHGPIGTFELGATDAYQLYTPVEPKIGTDVLNRMWDIGEQ